MSRLVTLWRELGRAEAEAVGDEARDQLIDFALWMVSGLMLVVQLAIAAAMIGGGR